MTSNSTPDPWVKMSHRLAVLIHYEPCSPYLEFHGDVEGQIKYLAHVFSEIFSTATGSELTPGIIRFDGTCDFAIEFKVHPAIFDYFRTDYKRFMAAAFGEIPFHVFGVSELSVFDVDAEMSRIKDIGFNLHEAGFADEVHRKRNVI